MMAKIYAREGTSAEQYLEKRRSLYKAGDWGAYESHVKQHYLNEMECQDKALKAVCQYIKISEQLIHDSVATHGKTVEQLLTLQDRGKKDKN